MEKIDFRRAVFNASAATLAQCPADTGGEVAFAGYSNTGKSSVINAITGVQGLARAGKTPGRTRLLNFFTLGPQYRLVDLPGYGYARVAAGVKKQWQETLSEYLECRRSLLGLMLIMDVRAPLRASDRLLLEWCRASGLPVHIILNKADKLSRSAARQVLKQVLKETRAGVTAQLFSARLHSGVDDSRKILGDWFRHGAHKSWTKNGPGTSL